MEQILKYSVKQIKNLNDRHVVVNCEYAIFGRLLSFISKLSQNTEISKIYLYNIDKIIIKNKLSFIKQYYLKKMNLGLERGPYYPVTDTKFLKYILFKMYKSDSVIAKHNYNKIITWEKPEYGHVLFFKEKIHKNYLLYQELITSLNVKKNNTN